MKRFGFIPLLGDILVFSEDGIEVGGIDIPPRSLLIPMIEEVHRHPLFWEAPGKFLPSRFSNHASRVPHPFSFLPFGAGARTCLGATLAPPMMHRMISMILQRFDVRLVAEQGRGPKVAYGFEIHPEGEVRVVVQERKRVPLKTQSLFFLATRPISKIQTLRGS